MHQVAHREPGHEDGQGALAAEGVAEVQPPLGRATRFMKAKPEASRPACTALSSKVSMKNSGSMDTTASSEPKVTK